MNKEAWEAYFRGKWVDGMTVRTFAKAAGVSPSTARKAAYAMGLPVVMRKRQDSRSEEGLQVYRKGMTVPEFAVALGVSLSTAKKWARRLGLEMRDARRRVGGGKASRNVICAICGKEFSPTSGSKGKFCSYSCWNHHRTKYYAEFGWDLWFVYLRMKSLRKTGVYFELWSSSNSGLVNAHRILRKYALDRDKRTLVVWKTNLCTTQETGDR